MRRASSALIVVASLVGCDSSNPTRPDTDARVTGIAIAGEARFTDLNQSHSLTATAQLDGAPPRIITAEATWRSSDPAVATVSPRGDVTSVGFGTATITASYQGFETVLVINVVLTDPSRLAGSYRLTFTVACTMPDWARRREYDTTVDQVDDRFLVLTVPLLSRQFEFSVTSGLPATETTVTIDFPTQLSYGYYGTEVPAFSHNVADSRLFTVDGTATGTLRGTGISGTLLGLISAQDFAAHTISSCRNADFSLTRQ